MRAKEAYARGSQAYGAARFEEALTAFQEASALVASPDLLFNIGLCHEQLENHEAAIRTFEAYLSAAPNTPDAAAVRARVDRLKRALARAAEPTKAQLSPTPPEARPSVELTHGAAPPRDEPRAGQWRPLMGVGIASLVVGAGIAAAGVVPALASSRDRADLDDVNGTNPAGYTAGAVRDLQDNVDRARVQQIALFTAGGAFAAVGIVLTALAARRRKVTKVRPSAWLSPQTAGIGWNGRF